MKFKSIEKKFLYFHSTQFEDLLGSELSGFFDIL